MTSESFLAPIRPNNLLADEVVTRLRQAIIEGKLAPGEHLAENTLAQQLAVSRSPVRDALRVLEREGLVSILPNRGCFVREFSPHDVDEIFSLRAAIESLAARWTIAQLSEADFDEMERQIEAQRQAVAAGDLVHLYQVDIAFHEYICLRSGHSRLMQVWGGIRSQCLALFHLRFRTCPDYVPQTVLTDHQRLLQAFREQNLDRVLALHEEVNERIVREVKELLVSAKS